MTSCRIVVLGEVESFQEGGHGKFLCRIGKKVTAPCLFIDFRSVVGTLTDEVRIPGLWKTVLSEVVQ